MMYNVAPADFNPSSPLMLRTAAEALRHHLSDAARNAGPVVGLLQVNADAPTPPYHAHHATRSAGVSYASLLNSARELLDDPHLR